MFKSNPNPYDRVAHQKTRTRQGAAAVEFAVVAPVFILLIVGMVEVGRGLMVQQILTNAAREGARQAIMEGATKSSVETIVTNYLSGSSISGGTVVVAPDPPSDAAPRDPVTVTISVPVSSVRWMLMSKYFPDSSEFSAEATMLTESQGW